MKSWKHNNTVLQQSKLIAAFMHVILQQNTRKKANGNQASDQVISIHPYSLSFSFTPNAFQTAFEASTILFAQGGW
jgi:hypothetical protein